MKYEAGLVSVIIPTYKRADKLKRAIKSVLNQSYSNLEVLVVNDNEIDDEYTAQLKTLVQGVDNDPRFQLLLQEAHVNGAVARNFGVSKSSGEYIAFLDDDDWWEPNKIELQVAAFQECESDVGVISCRIKRYNNEKLISTLPKYDDGYVYKDVMMLASDFATGTLLFRHECLDSTRCFDENLLRHQDLQLLVDFTSKYKLVQLDQPLHCCDVSDGQNRPDSEKLKEHKRRFFESVAPVFNTLTSREKRAIICMHRYELGYVCLKNKKIFQGVKFCLSIFLSFKAMRVAARKTLFKIRSRIF